MVKWETMWEGTDSQDVGLEAADASANNAKDDDVVDAEFEEVKDKK